MYCAFLYDAYKVEWESGSLKKHKIFWMLLLSSWEIHVDVFMGNIILWCYGSDLRESWSVWLSIKNK